MELQLSEKQMARIQYEAMLIKRSVQELYVMAPFLFHEGVTAANTVTKEVEPVVTVTQEETEPISEEIHNLSMYDDNYLGYA